MATDPIIEAAFGSPPADIDLDESLVVTNNAIAAVLLVVAAAAVIMRLWARKLQRADWRSDDWAIVVALIFNIGAVGMVAATGAYGSGKHIWSVTSAELVMAAKVLFYYTFVLGFCLSFNKLSMLFLYNRIFQGEKSDAFFRIGLWVSTIYTVTIPFILIIVMVCACQPTSHYWKQFGGGDGVCTVETGTFFWVYGTINASMDFLILLLPIPPILKLQMSKRKKAAVCGMMLLGSFVCIASIVRVVYMYRFAHSLDITWLMGEICVWSSIEPSVGIVSACLPNLKPLFGRAREKMSSNPSNPPYVVAGSHGSRSHWDQMTPGKAMSKTPTPDHDYDDEVQLTKLAESSSENVHYVTDHISRSSGTISTS